MSINDLSTDSMISFNQISSEEEDRLSDQVTNDQERSELGSQIDDDDGQIDFNEIISGQGNMIEMNPSYECMKYLTKYITIDF